MKIKKCWICWRCELGGVWINIRGLGTKPARGGGRSPRMDRAQMTLSTSSPSSSPQGLSFTGSQDKQWWENIARATTNTLLCSCYISGLEKVLNDLPPITFWHLILLFRPSPEDSGSGWWFWPQTSKYHNSGSNRGPAAGERDHSSTCEQASWIGNAAPAPRYFDSKWKLPTFHI